MLHGGWYQLDGNWYYIDPGTGTILSGGLYTINGKRYLLDEEGVMQKNNGTDGTTVYTIGADGAVTAAKRLSDGWTLSGGESFMAALSLALGMADQIRESSAAVALDMMFIDEGFGSLDDHARSQAVRVLQEMAGGDRLIGIISHVSEAGHRGPAARDPGRARQQCSLAAQLSTGRSFFPEGKQVQTFKDSVDLSPYI